ASCPTVAGSRATWSGVPRSCCSPAISGGAGVPPSGGGAPFAEPISRSAAHRTDAKARRAAERCRLWNCLGIMLRAALRGGVPPRVSIQVPSRSPPADRARLLGHEEAGHVGLERCYQDAARGVPEPRLTGRRVGEAHVGTGGARPFHEPAGRRARARGEGGPLCREPGA